MVCGSRRQDIADYVHAGESKFDDKELAYNTGLSVPCCNAD